MTDRHPPAAAASPPTPDSRPAITAQDVWAGYRDSMVVRGVSLEIPPGGILAIVGPNGSGKSTLIKSMFGLVRVQRGHVTVEDIDITHWAPADRLRRGVGYVPQLPSIFPSMTVRENLEMGLSSIRKNEHPIRHIRPIDDAFDLFSQLLERRDATAGTLSGGERRMLEIGRTMLLRPSVILLDEPSVGLSPALTKHLFSTLSTLRASTGVSLLIIEQNVRAALDICDEGIVVVQGQIAFCGPGQELLQDATVRQSFLSA